MTVKKYITVAAGVVNALLKNDAVRATKYINDKLIVRATRRTYQGKVKQRDNIEVLITIGRPNYAEREFIRLCKKAGEKFPVKKIQLKFASKK